LIVSTRAKICSSFIPMNECIDCGVCEPECPVEAIKPDTEVGAEKWLKLNADYAKTWPNITIKRDPPADSKEWEGICHWSLLPQSPEETLDIGKSGASTPSALHFLNYDVVKKTSLCWALQPRHMSDQPKL